MKKETKLFACIFEFNGAKSFSFQKKSEINSFLMNSDFSSYFIWYNFSDFYELRQKWFTNF